MINFLRRIRRNMMTEKKSDLYLVYAIGEVVLVVLGILIALQIDNWNENKKTRSIEQQYLLALKEEFSFNKGELESIMNRNKLNFENAVRILDNTGPENPELTDEELGRLLAGAFSYETRFDPNQDVLDEIISSGKLGIFSSKELKFALSSWSGILDRIRLQEQELLTMRSRTVEMVRNKANLRRVIYGPWLEELGIKQSKFEQESLHLLKSIAFEGHVTGFATMSFNLNNYHYPKLVEEIDKILSFIDDDIVE